MTGRGVSVRGLNAPGQDRVRTGRGSDTTPVRTRAGERAGDRFSRTVAPDREQSQLTEPVPVTETKAAFGAAF